jgi:GT2 family glycosyltransferase
LYENQIHVPIPLINKVNFIQNTKALGFSENHNNAFKFCTTEWFAVLNPDLRISEDPFPLLINCTNCTHGVIAPIVQNSYGYIEDSVRYFPSFSGLIKRFLNINNSIVPLSYIHPQKVDWVAGMFMLFPANSYKTIGGFDKKFFLYFEDVDICKRIWLSGGEVFCVSNVKIIHNAQRLSRKKLLYFLIHIKSLLLYFMKYPKYIFK